MRTAITGTSAEWTTAELTEPSNSRPKAPIPWSPTTTVHASLDASMRLGRGAGVKQLGVNLRRLRFIEAGGEGLLRLLDDVLCISLLPLSYVRVQLAHRPADDYRGDYMHEGDRYPAADSLAVGTGHGPVHHFHAVWS